MVSLIAIAVVGYSRAEAAPRPPMSGMSSWRLDFEFHDPQRISVGLPGDDEKTTYWYLLYRVTNDTGQDVQFFPSFRLVTNTLKVVEGGAAIAPRVYNAIAARHRRQYPFFAPPWKITGLLLQGAQNARVSAAVFRDFDPTASSFKVYASGLSGAVTRIPNPGFRGDKPESQSNERYFLLRQTLEITYDLPGDATTREWAKPVRKRREWVMR